jgi:RimJ/RimL family protein N-acetyltransferase
MREGTEEAARLMADGDQAGAERVLLGLLKERPGDARANYMMASLCDQRGQERRAIPFYRRALATPEELPEEDLAGAYLGLGSTHRVLGEYEASRRVLREGLGYFPDDRALGTFLALTLYNLGEHREATSILLENLTETTDDPGIRLYGRVLSSYRPRLEHPPEAPALEDAGGPRSRGRHGGMRAERFVALESERLLLRRFRETDLATFLAYRNDPEVARYQDWEGSTEEEALRVIHVSEHEEPFAPGEWFQFAVALKETEQLVGDLGFRVGEDGRQAEVGYTLAREHWGNGYASEAVIRLLDHAFGVLGLHRVSAVVDQENLPSIALLERIELRREGAFAENVWFKGRWSSEYLYATLREEWLAGK